MFKRVVVYLLTLEARLVLRKYKPRIVAVTGSVGKTATKDAIYCALAYDTFVRKSEKSFNSEIGIPLTILGLPNAWHNPFRWFQNLFDGLFLILFSARYPDWLVLEVGADRPNDIRSLASWMQVDIAVITRLPEVPVHVEYFDSPEEVTEEKLSLINTVVPGGAVVSYVDEQKIALIRERAEAKSVRLVTFGISRHADVYADDFTLMFAGDTISSLLGMKGKLHMHNKEYALSLMGAVGVHLFNTMLAAVAVSHILGRDIGAATEALQSYKPPSGRMHVIRGLKHSIIIDDTYNSSPAAVIAALDTLWFIMQQAPHYMRDRSIAVLGDMLELGRHSVNEHRKVGAHAARTCDLLITVGIRAREIAQGALDAGMADAAILQYDDEMQARSDLQNLLKENDCILVKGSQSVRLERVVEEIMEEPQLAKQLLVRQDEEWKKR